MDEPRADIKLAQRDGSPRRGLPIFRVSNGV